MMWSVARGDADERSLARLFGGQQQAGETIKPTIFSSPLGYRHEHRGSSAGELSGSGETAHLITVLRIFGRLNVSILCTPSE